MNSVIPSLTARDQAQAMEEKSDDSSMQITKNAHNQSTQIITYMYIHNA